MDIVRWLAHQSVVFSGDVRPQLLIASLEDEQDQSNQ